ncbi:MAG: hypothetical protein ACJ8AW_01495 [Rhodopila sp.]
MWALIIGNIVHETTDIDPTGRFPSDMNWQACPATTREGWAAAETNGVWTFAPPAVMQASLGERRAAAVAAIDAQAAALAAAGAPWGGKRIQVDDKSRGNLDGLVIQGLIAKSTAVDGQPVDWPASCQQ